MTGLFALVKRNTKLYFKDKGMFFSSLITPIILLVLYAAFLKSVYDDSFRSALAAAGVTISDSVINACVVGQLISSILAVSCITVAFCSNLLMIKDKTSGARHDLTISPISLAHGLGCVGTLCQSLCIAVHLLVQSLYIGLAGCHGYIYILDVA